MATLSKPSTVAGDFTGEALYYDPTRYDTYLEQLGVEYPTMETDSTRLRGTTNR